MNALTSDRIIRPGRKPWKMGIIRVSMFALGRAWQALYRYDRRLQEEIAEWPEGFRVMFRVRPHGPSFVMEKGRGRLCYCGQGRATPEEVDLIISFKNVECAFLVFTARMGIPQAYAEHRMSVRGDLYHGMAVVRSMNVVETYIFPGLIARQTVKRPVEIPLVRKHAGRLFAYLVGIPFGI